MIVFRQTDRRYPFAWESSAQPAGRWHGEGEGPAHYFADTPGGAWAEFIRHEEIRDAEDLVTVRRTLWAVELDEGAPPTPLNVWRCVADGHPPADLLPRVRRLDSPPPTARASRR